MRVGAMLGDVVWSLFRRPATEKYPFERWDTPERLRSQLYWQPEQCIGCGLCAKDCPTNAINLITLNKKDKRFVMRYYVDRCTFCGQCVESCRFNCLALSNYRWELAALSREPFIFYYGDNTDVESILAKLTHPDAAATAKV